MERRLRHSRTRNREHEVIHLYSSIARRALELADPETRRRMVEQVLRVCRKHISPSHFVMRALTLLPYDACRRLAREVTDGTCFRRAAPSHLPIVRLVLVVLTESLSHALCVRLLSSR